MRYRSVLTVCVVSAAALFAGPSMAQPKVTPAVPVGTKLATPPVIQSAALATGHYTLVLSASKNGQTKSSTFSVNAASSGASVTLSTPPSSGGTTSLPTASGAFSGKTFSMQLVANGKTLMLTGVAPTATTVSSLSGTFVTSKTGATSVVGTFTLTQSPVPPQAHAKIKNYGDPDPDSGGDDSGIIDSIGKWLDSLFNWG